MWPTSPTCGENRNGVEPSVLAKNSGGAIYATDDGNGGKMLMIDGSTLRNNTARRGGAINISPAAVSNVHLYIFSSTIGPVGPWTATRKQV